MSGLKQTSWKREAHAMLAKVLACEDFDMDELNQLVKRGNQLFDVISVEEKADPSVDLALDPGDESKMSVEDLDEIDETS